MGIGATTTIFSVVDNVLLRGLPYPDSGQLVYFDNHPHSFPDFADWRSNLESVSEIGAVTHRQSSISGNEGAVRIHVSNVTRSFLPLLGATPHLGRLFVEEDYRSDAPVALLDHGFWQQRWGSDPGVIGSRISVDGLPFDVVGILNPDFSPPEVVTSPEVHVWLPLDESQPHFERRDAYSLGVLARLRDGVSVEAARAEVDALTAALADEFPEHLRRSDGSIVSFPVLPLREATVGRVSDTLLLLLGAVGLMLLVACANVANLFLARGTARAGEIALRGALGANRGRIVRQLLTESALLALVGGAVGVCLGYVGVGFFTRYAIFETTWSGMIPRLLQVDVDLRILLFALVVSVGTGVLCGLFPAVQALRGSVTDGLREATANATSGRQRRTVQSALTVAELALTVVLLTGAGLLFRSLMERMTVEPGFRTEDLVTLRLEVGHRYTMEERARFVTDLRGRVEEIPGVRSAAAGWFLPLGFPGRCCVAVRSFPEGGVEDEGSPVTYVHPITPRYFETLGMEMVRGREFDEDDEESKAHLTIVNVTTALRVFGTDDVVGRRIVLGPWGAIPIVGVARGVHQWSLESEIGEAVYVPYGTLGAEMEPLHVAVWSDAPVQVLTPALQEAVRDLDPNMASDGILPMHRLVARSLATPRLLSILFGTFATLALLLACGGIYASMLYTVGQRRREMGIRLALGADGRQISALVLRDGARVTGVGLALGLVAALALSRLMAGLLWGITPNDGLTYALVCTLLGASAMAACWVPARRASRANVVGTLKLD
jgi:predicted permease